MKIGIFFGSTTGNTELAAEHLHVLLPEAELFCMADTQVDKLLEFDLIYIGASTWDIGELQVDWDCVVDKLEGLDFKGKTIALFGTGDSMGYPDSFVDAIGILHDVFVASGAIPVGFTSPEDYEYDESRAEREGVFLGLGLDDSLEEEHKTMLEIWVKQVQSELDQNKKLTVA